MGSMITYDKPAEIWQYRISSVKGPQYKEVFCTPDSIKYSTDGSVRLRCPLGDQNGRVLRDLDFNTTRIKICFTSTSKDLQCGSFKCWMTRAAAKVPVVKKLVSI